MVGLLCGRSGVRPTHLTEYTQLVRKPLFLDHFAALITVSFSGGNLGGKAFTLPNRRIPSGRYVALS